MYIHNIESLSMRRLRGFTCFDRGSCAFVKLFFTRHHGWLQECRIFPPTGAAPKWETQISGPKDLMGLLSNHAL